MKSRRQSPKPSDNEDHSIKSEWKTKNARKVSMIMESVQREPNDATAISPSFFPYQKSLQTIVYRLPFISELPSFVHM